MTRDNSVGKVDGYVPDDLVEGISLFATTRKPGDSTVRSNPQPDRYQWARRLELGVHGVLRPPISVHGGDLKNVENFTSFTWWGGHKANQRLIIHNKVHGVSHSPGDDVTGLNSMLSSVFDCFLTGLDFQSGVFSGTGFESLGKAEWDLGVV